MERVHTHRTGTDTAYNTNGHIFTQSERTRSEMIADPRSKPVSAPTAFTSNELLRSLPRDLFQKLRPSLRSVYLRDEQFLYMQDDRLEYVYFRRHFFASLKKTVIKMSDSSELTEP